MQNFFKSKWMVVVVAVVVIAAGSNVAWQRSQVVQQVSNAEVLPSIQQMPVTSESDVEYFPGARGFLVQPSAPGSYPGVVMIHENRGLRPETKMAAEKLAGEGYIVLAVDLLGRTVETQEEARALTQSFDQDTGIANMRAATQYVRGLGAVRVASLGWCFGGRQSVELAISGEPLDATVVYYGGRMATTVDKLSPIQWPVLGVFGDQDQSIPMTMVDEFRASLGTLGILNEVHVYPGVGHAFANPSGDNYAPTETSDAWIKTVEFLNKHLKIN